MSLQQFDERNPIQVYLTFDSTYTPNTSVDFTAPNSVPIRIDSWVAVSTDGSNHVATLNLRDGSGYHLLGQVTVTGLAGTAGAPPVDLLAAITPSDQKFLVTQATQLLSVSLSTAPSPGNVITIWLRGGTL